MVRRERPIHWTPIDSKIVCRVRGKGDKVQRTIFASDVTCRECKNQKIWKTRNQDFRRLEENVCRLCRNKSVHFWFEGKCRA